MPNHSLDTLNFEPQIFVYVIDHLTFSRAGEFLAGNSESFFLVSKLIRL